MTTALLVARMGSSRLPGKTMRPILGKPMIERMIERVVAARSIRQTVIATTHRLEDDPLAALADRLGIGCYRGSAEDVLARICGAMKAFRADPVVELLGDNPLVHSALIDDVVAFYRAGSFDYAVNVTTEYPNAGLEVAKFPVGIRVQVVSPSALASCQKLATTAYHREHSTSYIIENPEAFKVGYFQAKGRWAALNRPELTFAVNYRQNFDFVSRIFERCSVTNAHFTLSDALECFDSEPALHRLMGTPTPLSGVNT